MVSSIDAVDRWPAKNVLQGNPVSICQQRAHLAEDRRPTDFYSDRGSDRGKPARGSD
jgi:hypothetical protein